MDYDELVKRLRVWSLDERRGDGMLLVRTSDAIVQLQARVAELEAEISARSDLMQGYLDCWRNDKARADRAEADLAAARAALEHQRMALTIVRDRQHGNVSEADLNQGIALINAALAGKDAT